MNDFEEFNVTPELTLDPFQEEKKETPQIYAPCCVAPRS